MLIVEKFGGTSVADAACIANVARILVAAAREGNSVILFEKEYMLVGLCTAGRSVSTNKTPL